MANLHGHGVDTVRPQSSPHFIGSLRGFAICILRAGILRGYGELEQSGVGRSFELAVGAYINGVENHGWYWAFLRGGGRNESDKNCENNGETLHLHSFNALDRFG